MNINSLVSQTNINRAHGNLLSFMVSAMLTSAFFATAPEGIIHAGAGMPSQAIQAMLSNVQGSGWHGASTLAVAAAPAAPSAVAIKAPSPADTSLSDTQLVKIIGAIDKSEVVRPVIPEMAVLLGLPNDRKNTIKYHAFRTADGAFHIFAILNTPGNYLVIKQTAVERNIVRVDANFKFVAAATELLDASNQFKTIPPAEAISVLRLELAAWAVYADNSLAQTQRTASN